MTYRRKGDMLPRQATMAGVNHHAGDPSSQGSAASFLPRPGPSTRTSLRVQQDSRPLRTLAGAVACKMLWLQSSRAMWCGAYNDTFTGDSNHEDYG